MESANLYELQQQQLAAYSSSSPQSTAAVHQWNPSLHLNSDYNYDIYMNEILPNSVKLLTKNTNFPDMGTYDEYGNWANPSTNSLLQNPVDLTDQRELSYSSKANYLPKFSWPVAASSSNNYVFNNISSNLGLSSSTSSSLGSTHLAIDFMSNGENCGRLSTEELSFSCYDRVNQDSSYIGPSISSNKTSACKNEAIPGTKRGSNSTPFHMRRPSLDDDKTAKKPRAKSQSSCHQLPKAVKEKIGDRIAGLHRLVAPFGKTDTASVLTEAIGYIQFLQDRIQTLSVPCTKPTHSDRYRYFQGVFSKQDEKGLEAKQDLKNRGLCLVPLSFASYVSSSCTGFDQGI